MSDITKISTTTQKKWLCDVCKEASFESFEEACQHEEECAAAERPGESGELPAISGGGTADISCFFAALASDDQRVSSSAVADSSLSAAAVTAEPAADANSALVTALERGSEGSMEESNQTIHSRTLVRNGPQRGVSDDSLDSCCICNEHYNLGSSAGSPPDRRPVLTPNCCGNTLCMQCAELHRTAKVTELSGNKKKIPCPFCNAPFHSENERFVVNKFAMRYLERRLGSGSNDNVPSSSLSAAMQPADPAGDDTSLAVAAGSFDRSNTDDEENGPEGDDEEAGNSSGKRKSPFQHLACDIGDKIRKSFPGHGVFVGTIVRLPTSDSPYYGVYYSDGDSEDIHDDDISQYVAEYKRMCRRDDSAEDPIQQEVLNEEDEDKNDEDNTVCENDRISRRKIHETLKEFYFNGKVGTGNSNHAPFCKLGDNSSEESFQNVTLVFLEPSSWDIGAPSVPRANGYMRYRTKKPAQYRDRCFNEESNVWRKLIVFRKMETKKACYRYLGNYRFELNGKGSPKIEETLTVPYAVDSPRGKAMLRRLKGDSCVEDALGWFTNLENWQRTPLRFVSYDDEFARRLRCSVVAD